METAHKDWNPSCGLTAVRRAEEGRTGAPEPSDTPRSDLIWLSLKGKKRSKRKRKKLNAISLIEKKC